MKLTVIVGCDTCSCGSIETFVVNVDEHEAGMIDYTCNNCDSKTSVVVRPYQEGDELDNEDE